VGKHKGAQTAIGPFQSPSRSLETVRPRGICLHTRAKVSGSQTGCLSQDKIERERENSERVCVCVGGGEERDKEGRGREGGRERERDRSFINNPCSTGREREREGGRERIFLDNQEVTEGR
jgi:hypothetical protein